MKHPYFDPVRDEVEAERKEKIETQNVSVNVITNGFF
jgi:hypothetical protein